MIIGYLPRIVTAISVRRGYIYEQYHYSRWVMGAQLWCSGDTSDHQPWRCSNWRSRQLMMTHLELRHCWWRNYHRFSTEQWTDKLCSISRDFEEACSGEAGIHAAERVSMQRSGYPCSGAGIHAHETIAAIKVMGGVFSILPYLPHSSELASSDFYLFVPLKDYWESTEVWAWWVDDSMRYQGYYMIVDTSVWSRLLQNRIN